MEYPGYILSNRLPSVKSIHAFTDELINYLFPVTDEPEMFMEHHESFLYKLQDHFQKLLESVDTNNKLEKDAITEHFFSKEATSSFLVEHAGRKVEASVKGRNELPNVEIHGLINKIRNLLIGLGAMIGLNYPQWKALVKGILTK